MLGAAAVMGVTPAVAEAQSRGTVTISGSTSVYPLAAQLARTYVRSEGRGTRFRIAQGGSDIGVADAAAGRVTIGLSSRDPLPNDPGGIVFSRISRDALCVVTNPANRVNNLSEEQIRAVYGGRVRDWGGVPGATVSGTVQVVVRVPASGTQDAFQALFLGGPANRGGTSPTSTAQVEQSNGLVAQAVRSNPRAIGYVSLAFARGLNPVQFKGVDCTLRNARSGQYGGARNFYFVSRGRLSGQALRFYRWVRRDRDAQRVIATAWVPLR